MNKRFSKNNKSRHPRYTSDIFELATAITNQTNVNCVAIMPNNLEDMPQHVLDFARNIPTTWQETQFIDGYPTKYCIIARKHDGHWYIGGLNGTDHPMTLTVNLPMLAGKIVKYYVDKPRRIIKQEDKENVDRAYIQMMEEQGQEDKYLVALEVNGDEKPVFAGLIPLMKPHSFGIEVALVRADNMLGKKVTEVTEPFYVRAGLEN